MTAPNDTVMQCVDVETVAELLADVSNSLGPFVEEIKHLSDMLDSTYGCFSRYSDLGNVSGLTSFSHLLEMVADNMDQCIDRLSDPGRICS